jgi:NADPH:quinone reductase-like Zn-dependent oxidoreductase
VQLTHAAGAKVAAAARGARKLELARAHGALVAVDYSEPGWTDRVRDATRGVHVVFDGAGGEIGRAAFELTVSGGRFSANGMPAGGFAVPGPDRRDVTVRGIEQVQFAPQEAQAPDRAGAVRGGGGTAAAGDRADVSAGAGRRGACRDRGARGGREDPPADLSSRLGRRRDMS